MQMYGENMTEKTSATELLFSAQARTFLVFCRTGNMAAACRELGLSSSAVSRQLAKFESDLGVDLIDRTGYPIAPNAAGRELAKQISEHTKPLISALQGLRSDSRILPALRLGAFQSAKQFAPDLIERVKPFAGNILFLSGASVVMFNRLISGELDAILSSRSYDEAEGLRRHLILQEPTVIVMPKTLAETRSRWNWNALQICGLPYIRNYRRSTGVLVDTFLNSISISFPSVYEVSHSGIILSLVARGLGWGLVRPSQIVCEPDIFPEIAVIPMPEPVMQTQTYLIDRAAFPMQLHQKLLEAVFASFQSAILPFITERIPWVLPEMVWGTPEDPIGPGSSAEKKTV